MKKRYKGFTLLELLVVMSLLAVIMLAMGSSLRSMAQTESRVDERLQRADQMRVAHHFLRQTLGRVDVVKIANHPDQKGRGILFSADESSVTWIGIMPARYGAGGRYFFRLAVESAGSGNALVVRYAPWSPTANADWGAQSASHILVNDVTQFSVEAEGLPVDAKSINPEWPRGWHSGWPVKDALPQRLRLAWSDDKGAWPPLVVTLIPAFSGQSAGSGGFVAGGT